MALGLNAPLQARRDASENSLMCVFQIAKEENRPRSQGRASVQSHSSELETGCEERVTRNTASLISLT